MVKYAGKLYYDEYVDCRQYLNQILTKHTLVNQQ